MTGFEPKTSVVKCSFSANFATITAGLFAPT